MDGLLIFDRDPPARECVGVCARRASLGRERGRVAHVTAHLARFASRKNMEVPTIELSPHLPAEPSIELIAESISGNEVQELSLIHI